VTSRTRLVALTATIALGLLPAAANAAAPSPASSDPATYTAVDAFGETYLTGEANIGLQQDDDVQEVDLPFPVSVFGQQHDSLIVSSNGNVQFGDVDDATDDTSSNPLPNYDFGLPTLFAFQDDQVQEDAAAGQGIFTRTFGQPGHRRFLVEWRSRPYAFENGWDFANPGAPTDHFAVVLYENSKALTTLYGGIDGASRCTIGVQFAQRILTRQAAQRQSDPIPRDFTQYAIAGDSHGPERVIAGLAPRTIPVQGDVPPAAGTRVDFLPAGESSPAILPAAPAAVSTDAPKAGERITLTGSGFNRATSVLFGDIETTDFTVESDGRLSVTVPAGVSGTVHLRIRNSAGDSGIIATVQITIPVPQAPVVDAPAPAPAPPVAPRRCAAASAVITQLRPSGSRLRVAGAIADIADRRGAAVTVFRGSRQVGTTTVGSDGQFSTTVSGAGKGRISATVGPQRSPAVSLRRSLEITGQKVAADAVVVTGRLTSKRAGNVALMLRGRTSCTRTTVIKRFKTRADGSFSISLPRPTALEGNALDRIRAVGDPRIYSLPIVVPYR
jgi:hypothetical protein